jgi:hypothetical protein
MTKPRFLAERQELYDGLEQAVRDRALYFLTEFTSGLVLQILIF